MKKQRLTVLILILSLVLAASLPPCAPAEETDPLTGVWEIDIGRYLLEEEGISPEDPGYAAAMAKYKKLFPVSWTFGGDGTFIWTFEDQEMTCSWARTGSSTISAENPTGYRAEIPYSLDGDTLVMDIEGTAVYLHPAAADTARDEALTGAWVMDMEAFAAGYAALYGTEDVPDESELPYLWEFSGDGTLTGHFPGGMTAEASWEQLDSRTIFIGMDGAGEALEYSIADGVLTLEDSSGMKVLYTRQEETFSRIPSSEWKLVSGEWWMITGFPDLKDYYLDRADTYISIDAAGTFRYTETWRGRPDRVYVVLEGTFADDGKSLQVSVADTELTVAYTLEGDTLSMTANGVTAVYERQDTETRQPILIPTSSWILSGGTWWDLVGQPDLEDYYRNRAAVTLSFDAWAGTVSYRETGITSNALYFSLEGTYTGDASTATVTGGGMELTVRYFLEGSSLYLYTENGLGIFTRAE